MEGMEKLIPHVFLPLKLPGKTSDSLISDENKLLRLLLQTISEYKSIPQIKETSSLFETWVKLQVDDHEICSLQNAIQKLKPGQLFALYVRAQNCGLLISIPRQHPDDVIWSTFPACQRSGTVTGSQGDLMILYPATSIEVKRLDVLYSLAFAKQLRVLISYELSEAIPEVQKARTEVKEIRDVCDNRFISGWLPGVLVTKESTRSFGDVPEITKKIRDSVVIKDALLPFRRSGMWTTAKVVLQISLIRDLDNVRGVFLYKIIILRVMLEILKNATFATVGSTGIEMLKKIGRRIRKLEKFKEQVRHMESDFIDAYNILMKDATNLITSAREKIDSKWNEIISDSKRKSTVALSGAKFNLTQSLSGNGLLGYLTSPRQVKVENSEVAIPHIPPRHRINLREKYIHSFSSTASSVSVDVSIMLFDFERNVWHNWSQIITVSDSEYVWKEFHEYLEVAMNYYNNDPLGMSRLIITLLKIIQIWDRCVGSKYPLVKGHKIGVEVNFVKMLLVPTKEELEIVNDLEVYFQSRELATASCLLEEKPHTGSFAVRYAQQNSDMETLRERILEEGRQRAKDKLEEVENARKYCQSLKSRMSSLNHSYYTDSYGGTSHSPYCELCRLEKEEIDYRVRVYEKPLPEALHDQRAVVFELLIPGPIACLRDLLLTFAEGIVMSTGSSTNHIQWIWHTDSQLSGHSQRSFQWKIRLGSTTKHFVDSHYAALHPSSSLSSFVVTNGYNLLYIAGNTITFQNRHSCSSHIKNWCTLKVEPGSQYASMQWAIDGNNQTPNEVLARQSECHKNLSTSEFVEFGSLRCYDKLQIRNLIKAVVLGTLSFKNESVFNLICQSLWECSPCIAAGVREAHEDYANSMFLLECLSIMDDLKEKHKDNWQDHYVIMTVIVFAVNVAEKSVNKEVLDKAGALLVECRELSKTWSKDIQNVISEMRGKDTTEKEKLTLKLIDVNICRAYSYGAHKQLGRRILDTSEHVKDFLQAIVIVYDHLAFISENRGENASRQTALLMRRVIELGVDIEEYLRTSPCFDQGLNMFVRTHYGGADDLDFSNDTPWMFYETARQIYYLVAKKKKCADQTVTLQLDIVTGNFLVNGCTVSRLPSAIETHGDYQRVFPTMSFEVQPLGPNEVVTKYAYSGSYYSFILSGNTLFVEEITSDRSNRRKLIPSTYLPSNFPHKFEHNFSHWVNEQTGTVEFFPRLYNEPSKIMGKECELLLAVRDVRRQLKDLQSGRVLADIRCPTFQRIAKVFNRLESTTHIHVWRESNGQYTIELPRLRLTFAVTGLGSGINNDIIITSQEYDGMRIATHQQMDTLVGLNQGLLLSNDVEKILLVPHGDFNLNGHHDISISTSNLFEPPYFRYDVDGRLGQLKAGETQTGWFYLAYLHAVTSSFVPDPFTGVTGTERALQILKSGVCFPSQPFSRPTVRIIEMLRELSPTRSYYPTHLRVMETVHWPSYISPLAAHDNFVHVIDNLVTKSNRLAFLIGGSPPSVQNIPALRSKAAWRRAIISNQIDGVKPPTHCLHSKLSGDFTYSATNVEQGIQVSHLCHLATIPELKIFSLLSNLLLCHQSLLAGFENSDLCSRTVCDWMSVDFTNSWLGIYNVAKKVKRNGQRFDWILLLSYLAFRENDKVSMHDLAILNAIAAHSESFDSINPPQYLEYSDTSQYEYSDDSIDAALSSCRTITLNEYASEFKYKKGKKESQDDFLKRMTPSYESERKAELVVLKATIKNHWPSAKIESLVPNRTTKYYDWSKANQEVNVLFNKWFRNRELYFFLKKISSILENICAHRVDVEKASDLVSKMLRVDDSTLANFISRPQNNLSNTTLMVQLEDFVKIYFDKRSLDYCEFMFRGNITNATGGVAASARVTKKFPLEESSESEIFNEFIRNLRNSWNQWQEDSKDKDTAPVQQSYQPAAKIWENIVRSIEQRSKIYFLSDWCPRLTPINLLPLISHTFESGTPMDNLKNVLGAYAVIITKEQQKSRMERYKRQGNDLNLLEMEREASNIGHTNWNPMSYPDWLLLEIENDFLIRPLQVDVAQNMQFPVEGKNSLMQMNMGEGKTAVIIPLLALSLADGSRLCRITVLRSLYQINMKSLSLKIGGLLLNRRVYTMPCRRDYAITAENVNLMLEAYQECLYAKGVLLTLPEYRLSFELKKHEKALGGHESDSRAINNVLGWLRVNARDVLDESDEILQVKYQLLYTLGLPLTINGGSLRWTITEKVLRLVPNRIKHLLEDKRLQNQFELKVASSGQEFPHCRVLSENAYSQLCAGLSEDVIKNGLIPEPPPALRDTFLKYLTQEILDGAEMERFYESSSFSLPTHKDTFLILRGLLACGVLRSSLSKRWRVNFGVNPSGHRRMAVPFRAKDIAAERAEFGHPDMAITLTLLSYYYSGLSIGQLEDTFTRLFKLNFAEEEYQSWVALLPPTTTGYTSIKKLSGVNLRDYRQKYNVLFPAFRRNMATIDFWLGQAVFPVESKQFGSKIGCSAWDLCRDNTVHPTTGFSGTNDTKLLLPRTIQQRDLPELVGTNGKVLENLLRPENDFYEGLKPHISAKEVIEKMVAEKIRVLLDVGAIMLELSNDKVADEWMGQCREIDAVVFFDDRDHLLVKARLASRPVEFEISPFRNRLDRCGIYLDEIHTRGTDLKIPLGTTAVVTLGKGVRKDTLAQGCMRMRKLGQGHKIRFWGSSEVHPQILKFASDQKPGSLAVLRWAIQNSVQFLEEGFIHWAGSGTYELQKRTAEKICGSDELKLLAQLCSQNEVLELKSMYGFQKSMLTYPSIAKNMILRTIGYLHSNLVSSTHTLSEDKILADSRYMLDHLNSYVGKLKRTTNVLDEEQERELEHELEEETEVERPPKATAQKHVLNQRLRTFIKYGHGRCLTTSDIMPLREVFIKSGLWNDCKTATYWGYGPKFIVRATEDFERTVVQNFYIKSNDFLRPVQWIYNTVIGGVALAILMSPFEVNGFWEDFKDGKGSLYMYGPRLFREQETLHECGPLMVPSRPGTRCDFLPVMTATLDMVAGSLYFRNKSDERFYCHVVGISSKPRPPEEEAIFQVGGIVHGFIEPIYRKLLPMFDGVSAFDEHPEKLIRGIIEARHGVFSDKTHVGSLISYGLSNFQPANDTQ